MFILLTCLLHTTRANILDLFSLTKMNIKTGKQKERERERKKKSQNKPVWATPSSATGSQSDGPHGPCGSRNGANRRPESAGATEPNSRTEAARRRSTAERRESESRPKPKGNHGIFLAPFSSSFLFPHPSLLSLLLLHSNRRREAKRRGLIRAIYSRLMQSQT